MEGSTQKIFLYYLITLSIALSIAYFTRHFILETFQMTHSVMNPTLLEGDVILVWKLPYALHLTPKFKRGEIIIYDDPKSLSPTSLARRIVGLPGDQIEYKNGHLFLNGSETGPSMKNGQIFLESEKTESLNKISAWPAQFGPITVSAGMLFVVGDGYPDRKTFIDAKRSKYWDQIPSSAILGRALTIWLSIDHDQPHGVLPHFRWERFPKWID